MEISYYVLIVTHTKIYSCSEKKAKRQYGSFGADGCQEMVKNVSVTLVVGCMFIVRPAP